jgi:hypothetical protein
MKLLEPNKWIPKRFVKYALVFFMLDWISGAVLFSIFGNYEIHMLQQVWGLVIR